MTPEWEDLLDETTILHFRHLLAKHGLGEKLFEEVNAHLASLGHRLKTGAVMDANIIAGPSSAKNHTGERESEMHRTKKGNQRYFGMKVPIGVDADSGLAHRSGDEAGERIGRSDGARAVARGREAGVGRCGGVSRGGQARGEPGQGRGPGGDEGRQTPTVGQRAWRRSWGAGRAQYAQRKRLSEAPHEWIKEALGLRRFSVRGPAKVRGEWNLVCPALNIRRLRGLQAA